MSNKYLGDTVMEVAIQIECSECGGDAEVQHNEDTGAPECLCPICLNVTPLSKRDIGEILTKIIGYMQIIYNGDKK